MEYAGYSKIEIHDSTKQKRVERLKKKLVIPSDVGTDPWTRYNYLEQANFIDPRKNNLSQSLYKRKPRKKETRKRAPYKKKP